MLDRRSAPSELTGSPSAERSYTGEARFMRRLAGITAVALLAAGAFASGLVLTRADDRVAQTLRLGSGDAPTLLIDQVRQELMAGYYTQISSRTLERRSIDAIIDGLDDPYTDYLTAGEYEDLQRRTARSYSGVGLTVGRSKRGLIVKQALAGPAREAGIKRGDRIVSIDGHSINRLAFRRSLELLKGEEGTSVSLTVRRPREEELRFRVERSAIALPAVRSRLVTTRHRTLAHVRVLSFRVSTVDNVENRIHRLVKRGAEGVVLDLRGNPGGLLSQAVGTVSLFLDEGVVCVTDGIHHGRHVYRVSGQAPLADVPLVVLVDSRSASAAEIVAAALEDHERAILVGEATYGKASVQSVRPLTNGDALKLTTAVYRTPNGANLTGHGITPDVEIRDRPATRADEALGRALRLLASQLH
jgi:carboxyl-terminal processing protease